MTYIPKYSRERQKKRQSQNIVTALPIDSKGIAKLIVKNVKVLQESRL